MGCFVSCRISTDKRVARSLCHSRATCFVNRRSCRLIGKFRQLLGENPHMSPADMKFAYTRSILMNACVHVFACLINKALQIRPSKRKGSNHKPNERRQCRRRMSDYNTEHGVAFSYTVRSTRHGTARHGIRHLRTASRTRTCRDDVRDARSASGALV